MVGLKRAREKLADPHRYVENGDGASHVEQVQANPWHETENEAPGEKRQGRNAEERAREHLDRQTDGRELPLIFRHGFAFGQPLQEKPAEAGEPATRPCRRWRDL